MEIEGAIQTILANKARLQVWSLPSNASVYEAVAMMADKHVGALLVIDDGQLIGIISERDYARKIILQGRSSKETQVSQIMTSPVETATPDQSLSSCLGRMSDGRFRHLPVVEEGRVIGVISTGDIVKHMLSAQKHTIEQLHAYISGSYPAP